MGANTFILPLIKKKEKKEGKEGRKKTGKAQHCLLFEHLQDGENDLIAGMKILCNQPRQ